LDPPINSLPRPCIHDFAWGPQSSRETASCFRTINRLPWRPQCFRSNAARKSTYKIKDIGARAQRRRRRSCPTAAETFGRGTRISTDRDNRTVYAPASHFDAHNVVASAITSQ